MGAVASALSAVGDFARAEAVARSIGAPQQQTQSLIELAHQVDPQRARAIVAWILRHRGSSDPLTTLARVQPEVIVAVADRFIQTANVITLGPTF